MILRYSALLAMLWLLLVPVAGKAVAAGIQLPVPSRTIHPGDEVTRQDIVEKRFPKRTTQQFSVIADRAQLIGLVARRTLLPGRPIPVNAVSEQMLVQRGQPGRLVFREQGLHIVMQVEVLQSGGAGDLVRVRNIDSGVVVSGTVQGDGSIQAGN